MLVFKSILNSGLTDKQILFQLARINSWISLNGKIANSYKSKIYIDFRGLTNDIMKKLGYEPNTIIKNTVETDPTIFQADNKCGVKYPYVSAPDSLLLDTKLNPAQKVLLLILKEVWLDNNDKQLLPYCQTETIFKQIPNYKHTRDYINKLILSLQEKGYISFDTIKNHGRVNVRISFDGNLKDVKEELSNQIAAEDEIKEMVEPVEQLDNDIVKIIAEMKKEIDELKKENAEMKKEIDELKKERKTEKTEVDNLVQEDKENIKTVEQVDKLNTELENNFGVSLQNISTDDKQPDDSDDISSFMTLIPEGGEYSQEEIEAVKNDNEPVMKQRKAECSADSLFNLANDIDFKALMKDVSEDIKSSKEHRSNIWRSSKKDEYQEHIKELKNNSSKEEIIEYIVNTVNEKNSRTLINSLDENYYKLTMRIVKENQDRITNLYYKNVGDFEIHQSSLEEFVA